MATDGDIISLIDFDRRWLSRLLRTVNLTHRTREIEFTYGELLESYFWLLLGTELEYFPEYESQLLASQRFGPLFIRAEAVFRFSSYRIDASLLDILQTHLNSKTLLSPPVNQAFQDPTCLQSSFEHALELETEFALDDEVGIFLRALAILPTGEIGQVLIDSNKSIISFEATIDRNLLLRSFALCIQHMEAFRDLTRRVSANNRVSFEDQVLFKTRIRQLVRWRISLENEEFEKSFKLIANWLYESTDLQMDADTYLRWLEGLSLTWNYSGGITATN